MSTFRFPRYPRRPHASGQARITIHGKDYYLGVFDSTESRAEYARLATQFAATPRPEKAPAPHEACTVAEVVTRWHAQARADRGDDCREVKCVMDACKPLQRLRGHTLAAAFDDMALEEVRSAMIDGSWLTDEERAKRIKMKAPIGWCREYVNHQVSRIRTVWRWAERKRLVPKGSWGCLSTLPPIERFKKVRRAPIRRAVDDATVEAAIAELSPIVGAMVRVHLATGMRPGELVRMQAGEVELRDGLGEYTIPPDEHKDGWRDGQAKVVILPPDAVAAIAPWLEAAKRIGPHVCIWRPSSDPHHHYGVEGYYRAVARACERAGVPHFCPYSMRHRVKQRITREHGLDAARAALGQKSIGSTDRYSREQDLETARKVARGEKK